MGVGYYEYEKVFRYPVIPTGISVLVPAGSQFGNSIPPAREKKYSPGS